MILYYIHFDNIVKSYNIIFNEPIIEYNHGDNILSTHNRRLHITIKEWNSKIIYCDLFGQTFYTILPPDIDIHLWLSLKQIN